MSNPLVAERQDSTTAYSGIGIVESAVDTYNGISSGSWVEGGLGLAGAGLETLGLVIDPVGTLVGYGVAWLMEHVKPLSDALDWLAGDPDTIASYAQTWRNVSQAIGQAKTDFDTAVSNDTAAWTGTAADNYRRMAAEQSEQISAAATSADTVGTVVEVVGVLVGVVREVVRDLIADCVATLIARIPQWLAEIAGTLGIATPHVVASAVTLISRWVARISDVIQKLVRSVNNLRPLLRRLDEIWAAIRNGLHGLSPGSPSTPSAPSSPNAPGSTTPVSDPGSVTPPTVNGSTPTTPGSTPGPTPTSPSAAPTVSPSSPSTPSSTPAPTPTSPSASPTVAPSAPSTPSPTTPAPTPTSPSAAPTVAPSAPSTPSPSTPTPTATTPSASPTVTPSGPGTPTATTPAGTTPAGTSPSPTVSPSSPGSTPSTPGTTPGAPSPTVTPGGPTGSAPGSTPSTPTPGSPSPGTTPGSPTTPLSDADFKKLPIDEQTRIAQSEVDAGNRTFPNDADAVQYGRDHWNDYVDDLPDDQRQAVRDYTAEPDPANPDPDLISYQEINAALRGSDPIDPAVQQRIDLIDEALAGNPLTESVVISRGTGIDHLGIDPMDLPGRTFTEQSYLSTSLGGPASGFDGKQAILHMEVPAGTPAIWVEAVPSHFPGERELLLGRGLEYRVDRVVFEGGQWHVYGAYLPKS